MINASGSPVTKTLSKSASMKSAASVLAAAFAFMAVTFFAGCATVPPVGLTDARWSYRLAQANPAARLVPVEMRGAREALDLAELSYLENGDSDSSRKLFDIAQRKSETAEGLAYMAFNQAAKDKKHADLRSKNAEGAETVARDAAASVSNRTSMEYINSATDTYYWWSSIYY